MYTFPKNITNKFFRFLSDEISVLEFADWIYENSSIADSLGEENYRNFTSFDYWQYEADIELKKLINDLYDHYVVDTDREFMIWVLDGMLEGTYDVVFGCFQMVYLRSLGFDFIPIEFVGFESVIDDIRRNYDDEIIEEKKEKKRLIDLYKKEILKISEKFFDSLTYYEK